MESSTTVWLSDYSTLELYYIISQEYRHGEVTPQYVQSF